MVNLNSIKNNSLKSTARINIMTIASIMLAIAIAAPIFAVSKAALQEWDAQLWQHLWNTVIIKYFTNSILLMLGTSCLALIFGISGAWVTARYRFIGHAWLEWMLLLPAAVPSYIVAYTYTDFFEYAGVVQTLLRDMFGWNSPNDYRFFEIRSLGGAIVVMGGVLYPYVYLPARTAFRLTPQSLYEVALLHNRSVFWSVALPMARPAVMAGLALVAMETIADFGTVEFFAVETLTLGVFNVWLGMNSLSAAAQISMGAFLLVLLLLGVETYYRSFRRFAVKSRPLHSSIAVKVTGLRAGACIIVCLIPLLLGFIIPVGVLLSFIINGYSLDDSSQLWRIIGHTLGVAGLAVIVMITVAIFLNLVDAYRGNRATHIAVFIATGGYAFPGTMLAIGALTLSGIFDSLWASITGQALLSGTIVLLIMAYVTRFNAAAYGSIRDGVLKLPPNVMNASLLLGKNFNHSIAKIAIPLLRNSIITGALLAFVDVMKELPMTLLLRPLDFETLATFTYQYAHSELLEEAALPALLIIASGLLPVAIMNMLLKGNSTPNEPPTQKQKNH